MKNGNYEEWLNRYYAGAATAEEVIILRAEGMINEEDELYASALQSERQITLSLEFEDFMNKINVSTVVAIPAPVHWIKRLLSAAAIIAVMISVYISWQHQKPTNVLANLPAKSQSLIPYSSKVANTAQQLVKTTTGVTQQKRLDNFVPRKTSSKLRNKKKLLKNILPKDDNWLVVVNGKPITDEKEAIAIANESLAIFSNNLSSTIEDLKQISQIKIKL